MFVRVYSTLSASMIFPHTNTGYEPNSEMNMAGRFVPIVIYTMTMTTGILICPTSRCGFPSVRLFHLTNLLW